MLENKHTITEMKNAFDGLVNRLGIICGIEEMLIETSAIKIQGGKKSMKRQKNIQELWNNLKRCSIYKMETP